MAETKAADTRRDRIGTLDAYRRGVFPQEDSSPKAAAVTVPSPVSMPRHRAGVPVEPSRILSVVARARRVLASGVVLGAVCGVGVAKTVVSREYEAAAILQWEASSRGDAENASRDLMTLVSNVKLPTNLEKVRAELKLPTTIERLGKQIDVMPLKDSTLISVSAKASDAGTAARLAEVMVNVFLEHLVQLDQTRRQDEVKRLQESVATARAGVLAARAEYDAFRRDNGIADLSIEMQAAIEHAARLRAEADIARVESEAETARSEKLQRMVEGQDSKTVLSETDVLPASRRLAEARAELAALRSTLSPDHPKVQAVEAQVAALDKPNAGRSAPAERTVGRNPLWDAAQQNLTMSAAQREAAIKKRQALAELASAEQGRIEQLSKVESQISTRLAHVRLAEGHLADVAARLAKAEDLSRAPSSGFRVLVPSKPPVLPSKSKRSVVALLGPLLGLLLAVGGVLWRALRGLLVCTPAELAYWGRAPVVAASTWPRDLGALDHLVADLEGPWCAASGSLLILGLGARRFTCAVRLEVRLGEIQRLPAELPDLALRRVARQADRVLVLVHSGKTPGPFLSTLGVRLGRTEGVGLVLVGASSELATMADQVGDVERFWGADVVASRPDVLADSPA